MVIKLFYFEALLEACEVYFILKSKLCEVFNQPQSVKTFVLEPARLLGACKPGLRACMDSTTGQLVGMAIRASDGANNM